MTERLRTIIFESTVAWVAESEQQKFLRKRVLRDLSEIHNYLDVRINALEILVKKIEFLEKNPEQEIEGEKELSKAKLFEIVHGLANDCY